MSRLQICEFYLRNYQLILEQFSFGGAQYTLPGKLVCAYIGPI
jgi:hypothetical protein